MKLRILFLRKRGCWKFLEKKPSLVRIHCIAHKLNLGVSDACKAGIYFKQINQLIFQSLQNFLTISAQSSPLAKNLWIDHEVRNLKTTIRKGQRNFGNTISRAREQATLLSSITLKRHASLLSIIKFPFYIFLIWTALN